MQLKGDRMPEKTYTCIGFLFGYFNWSDPEDYFDFQHKIWPTIELKSDLKGGVLPPGMLMRAPDGKAMIVMGKHLLPLTRELLDQIAAANS